MRPTMPRITPLEEPDWSDEQMMDLIFTVGNYNLVCMALNSLGVQLDPGLEGFKR